MDNRYYFNEIKDDIVTISGGEAQHLSKVRRAKVGDEIVAFNGDGFDYNLKIEEIAKDKVRANVQTKTLNKAMNDVNITVYLSMIKNDALTTAIDNLAELNVKQVKLFKSDYSVAQIDEKKLEKLNQIAIQASKQCERADIMQISIINKKDIEKDCANKTVFFAYENSNNKIEKFLGDFAVIIGPEGGFSQAENEYFSSFANNISLSKTILRAEVACVAGVSMLKAVSCES
ncbi:MAG: 16S rRNA (uracil(1498)-N(3))-methyltransferase [Clostridia bacterium]|nr:16S rRNA (uracil(1498)-N(3))-methyltransferase [Clostridia bacterium]